MRFCSRDPMPGSNHEMRKANLIRGELDMNAITRTAILLVFVSSVSSCTTTRKTDPEPAKMTLEENGKLVRMSYFDGAPFASIHDTPKEYCRSRQEKEVQLGFRIDIPSRRGLWFTTARMDPPPTRRSLRVGSSAELLNIMRGCRVNRPGSPCHKKSKSTSQSNTSTGCSATMESA